MKQETRGEPSHCLRVFSIVLSISLVYIINASHFILGYIIKHHPLKATMCRIESLPVGRREALRIQKSQQRGSLQPNWLCNCWTRTKRSSAGWVP